MGIEAMSEAAAVDVEGCEDLSNRPRRDAPVEAPLDDVEVFLAGFEAIENAIEEEGVVVKASLEKAEVAAVEVDPAKLIVELRGIRG